MTPPTATKYTSQRKKVIPPHVPLGVVRRAMGLSLDDVLASIKEQTGRTYTRGAISAVELGHRGASEEMLDLLTNALGLPPYSITTTYRPRAARPVAAVEDVA